MYFSGVGIIGYVFDVILVYVFGPGGAGVVIVWGFLLVKLESLNKIYW